MHKFCSNNALYSFFHCEYFFLFNSFWYLRLLFSLLMFKKVFKKHILLFCSLLNMKKQLSLMGLFLCLSLISLGQYFPKNVKSEELGKVGKTGIKGGRWPSQLYLTQFYSNSNSWRNKKTFLKTKDIQIVKI